MSRPMQWGRARLVSGVHVGPGVNQGPVNIEVGIPNGRAMQRRLAPPIPRVRIGPLSDKLTDLVLGFSGRRTMQSRPAIDK